MAEKRIMKMVIFDMDNTLLRGRFIDACAERFNFTQALELLRQIDKNEISLTVRVASFLKGKKESELLDIADSIPVVEDCLDVIAKLRQRGYRVGIISNSYQFVTGYITEKMGADFSMANELQFEMGVSTGEVLIPSLFHYSEHSLCRHQICKTNALLYACDKYKINVNNCTVIGDSENDLCMIRNAGRGIAFGTGCDMLTRVAHKEIANNRFADLLQYTLD